MTDEALGRGQGVLVHDKSGNSRAAAIIIAYVMYRCGYVEYFLRNKYLLIYSNHLIIYS